MRQHVFEPPEQGLGSGDQAQQRVGGETHEGEGSASEGGSLPTGSGRPWTRNGTSVTPSPTTAKTRSPALATDRVHAGKGAEGRQDADVRTEPEARQAQPIEGAPGHADARVQVAPEHVASRARARMVAKTDAADVQRLVDRDDTELRRRVAGAVVVVAPHQRQVQPGMGRSPAGERGQRRGRMRMARMQQIAEEDDAPRRRDGRRARSARRASRWSSPAEPARRGAGNSRPCRCAHRPPATCGARP